MKTLKITVSLLLSLLVSFLLYKGFMWFVVNVPKIYGVYFLISILVAAVVSVIAIYIYHWIENK